MTDTPYVMSVRIENGRYTERAVLFTMAKDILLVPGSEFEITDGLDIHEIDVYGIPNHETVLTILRELVLAQEKYRSLHPLSYAKLIVATYVDRSNEELDNGPVTLA